MIFERPLHPYPSGDIVRGRLEVEIDWEGRSWIYVIFRASGFDPDLLLPTGSAGRQDGLWKHTCCEIFADLGQGRYAEFNISPSGAWAAYSFDSYREGMAMVDVHAPEVSCRSAAGGFELEATLFWPEWPGVRALGASAVMETVDGVKTYWALAHPSDKPDFHHPDSFTLRSPALELP